MRYVLQVYFNGAQTRLQQLPDGERQAIVDEYTAFFRSPEVEDGNQLQPPDTATTVRVHEGETIRTVGPIAGTREPLGGYYLVEARDMLRGPLLGSTDQAAPHAHGHGGGAIRHAELLVDLV